MQDSNNDSSEMLMVSLSFKFGKQGGQDDDMTTDLCQKHGAERSDVKAIKRTICEEAFKPLKKLMAEFKNAVTRVTIPWDMKGCTFCKPEVAEKIIEFRNTYGPEFNRLKEEHLLGGYDSWKELTKKKLGSAWNENEFPSREELENNVHFKLGIMAMPNGAMMRRFSQISGTIREELEQSYDQRVQSGIRNGMATAYNRLMEPLQHMVDVLTDDKPRIYETLVENVAKIAENIPGLNLADDPLLSQFGERAKAMVANLSADQLRGDKPEVKVMRKKVAQQAAELLASFGTPGLRKFTT